MLYYLVFSSCKWGINWTMMFINKYKYICMDNEIMKYNQHSVTDYSSITL